MDAIKQKCRPKHQVLVLKCYPRTTKGAVDVKPNSSELSYLLYYASTRRSKLQKVGDFLEKRTTSDVWKGRIGWVDTFLFQLNGFRGSEVEMEVGVLFCARTQFCCAR